MKMLFRTLKFCWKITWKNAEISILVLLKWIVCPICPLYNLITFSKLILHVSWTILWQNCKCLVNAVVNHYFLVPWLKNADVIKLWLAPRLQKVCDWIYNRLSYTYTTFHDPSSSRSNFRWGEGGSSPEVVVDQRSPGQIGLTRWSIFLFLDVSTLQLRIIITLLTNQPQKILPTACAIKN